MRDNPSYGKYFQIPISDPSQISDPNLRSISDFRSQSQIPISDPSQISDPNLRSDLRWDRNLMEIDKEVIFLRKKIIQNCLKSSKISIIFPVFRSLYLAYLRRYEDFQRLHRVYGFKMIDLRLGSEI